MKTFLFIKMNVLKMLNSRYMFDGGISLKN